MPFNGTGQFNLDFNWNNDAANGIPITASRVQTEDQNIADGLSQCITTDGQSTTSAIIPFALGVSIGAGTTLGTYTTGSWTPVDGSGAGLSLTVNRATYARLGSLYFCDMAVVYPATASGAAAVIGGLPGVFANVVGVSGIFMLYSNSLIVASPNRNTATFSMITTAGVTVTNADLSTRNLYAQFMVFTV